MTRRFLVRGMVQGVGFRWFVARSARRLGITGYVRNLPDGSVEVVVSGDAAGIDALARALDSGPPGAAVAGVEVGNLVDATAFKSFDIL